MVRAALAKVKVEIRKAAVPAEIRSLKRFDRQVFPSDHFPTLQWLAYETHWLLVNNRKVGCCALEKHVEFADDLREDEASPYRKGSLYIASTGILPQFQSKGLGQLLKAWQVSYARVHGFSRIVTNTRKRNAAMLALNTKFGFRIVRTTPGYYSDPVDATVVMELMLKPLPGARVQRGVDRGSR